MVASRKPGDIVELLAQQLGVASVQYYVNRDASDADIADKIILRNNPRRIFMLVVNLGTGIVYARPLAPATSTAAIRLSPSGGGMDWNWREHAVLPSLEWHAIGSVDDQSLLIIEIEMLQS